MASPIYQAIKQICDEKNIKPESVVETIEAALAAAYRKDFGVKNQNIKIEFNPETGDFRVFDIKTVVSDELAAKYEAEKAEREKRIKEGVPEEKREEKEKPDAAEAAELKFNPKLNFSLTQAKEIKADAKLDEVIKTELEVPGAFGRMAAQTAKQVIIQKLREAERDTLYQEFKEKEGELLSGIVQRWEGKLVLVDLGRATALLPLEEQIEREKYNPGARLKFYVKEVAMAAKGPQIIVSRSHPEILRKLFTFEIPEAANGVVQIKAIAREAGARSKVAVWTGDENIDPIGSCIGQRGARIQTIIGELGGEKVDVIEWNDDAAKLIANALSPAKVSGVEIKEEEKIAIVSVKADQLSLAIGKGGQNVRLAARLSGWKINIKEEEIKGQEKAKEGEEKAVEKAKEGEGVEKLNGLKVEGAKEGGEGAVKAEVDAVEVVEKKGEEKVVEGEKQKEGAAASEKTAAEGAEKSAAEEKAAEKKTEAGEKDKKGKKTKKKTKK